jgi:integrase
MTPSQAQRTAKAKPRRAKHVRYDVDSYRRAITYAIIKARKSGVDVPRWYPLQLRHTRATEIRRRFGIEAAQVSLGHARADVTQVYAERNLALASEIAQEIG